MACDRLHLRRSSCISTTSSRRRARPRRSAPRRMCRVPSDLSDLGAHAPSARRRVNASMRRRQATGRVSCDAWTGVPDRERSARRDVDRPSRARRAAGHSARPVREPSWVPSGGGDRRHAPPRGDGRPHDGAAQAGAAGAACRRPERPGRRPRAHRRSIVGARRRRAERAALRAIEARRPRTGRARSRAHGARRTGSTSAISPARCSRTRGSIAAPPRSRACRTSRT